jgi:DNA polymerase III delta prime subunit
MNYTTPAQLWLGCPEELVLHAQHYLQKLFCLEDGCATCKTCSLITKKQYHAILWLYPEKQQYTISSLEPITETVSFALEKDQHFFFVIEKADFLSVLCQNMLLKTIEEPPAGYHFLLLAERKEHILPTLQSRCHIKNLVTHKEQQNHPLMQFFTQKIDKPFFLFDELEKNTLHEQESIELLDSIIAHWLKQYTEKSEIDAEKIQKKLQLLLHAQQQQPMPGSSKLFWKNLFLQWQEL